MKGQVIVSVAALAMAAGVANAQVDGTYKSAYGDPVALQTTPTGFGDSNLGGIHSANGSELDGVYAYQSGGNLNLLFTGNLETNYNKFEIFIDNGSGTGQQTLDNSSFFGLPGNFNGMKMDNGFKPTHWISLTCGGGQSTSDGYGLFVNGGRVAGVGGNAGDGDYLGGSAGAPGSDGVLAGFGGNNFLNVKAFVNNSNTFGVTGADLGFGPDSASTGMEVQIPLASLGVASMNGLKVAAMINGQGHDYLSNQVLGGLPAGSGNLGNNGSGGLSNVDFSAIAGNQYVTLVPAPASLALLGLGGLVAGRRRRA